MAKYKTKQGEQILEYLKSRNGEHIKAIDIKEYFLKEDISIGLTTIYRHLSTLEEEGKIHKYVLDSSNSACFEYIDSNNSCKEICFHLKCEECDKLVHFDCDLLKGVDEHILEEHDFYLNPKKTVYYGLCKDCKCSNMK